MNVINTTILKAPEVSLQTLSVTPSVVSQSITPSVGYAYDEVNVDAVTSAIDNNILASNIRSGVSILGVNGNVISANTTSLTASPSTVAQTFSPSAPYNGFDTVTLNAMQLQSRTVSPSTVSQTITPSTGYDGLNTVTVNAMQLQTLSVQPSIASQTISASAGYDGIQEVTFDAVTSSIDASIQPENIVEGVTILGVEGTATFPPAPVLSTLQVSPSTSSQSFTPSGFDGWDSVEVYGVTSSIDANIDASNIKSGVSILGVTGNVVELNTTSTTVSPSTISQTITPSAPYNGFNEVTLGAVTSSIDPNIQAGNIISGKSILGVNGTAIELNATTTTVTPSIISQTITPPSPYNALSVVTIDAVTSSIDNNIQASNIKSGVSILGVQGTYVTPINLQTKTVSPSTSSQTVQADVGYDGLSEVTVNAVTSSIDPNITPSNIVSGVSILGVDGTAKKLNAIEIIVGPSTQSRVYAPTILDPYNAYNKVTVNAVTSSIDSNITASNIKSGISILGVSGTASILNATSLSLTISKTSQAQQTITPTAPYNAFSQVNISVSTRWTTLTPNTVGITLDTGDFWDIVYVNPVTASIDSNIVSENIKSGVSILGVTGTLEEAVLTNIVLSPSTASSTYTPTSPFNGFDSITLNAMSLETVNVSPSTASQTISAASEYDALGTVNIASVTSAIDANIQAENIKSGVTILGVTGTYEGGGGDSSWANDVVSVSGTLSASIRAHAFDTASSLQTVDLPNATYVGSSAFISCSSLTTVSPMATCIGLGTMAFGDCSSLSGIIVGNKNSLNFAMEGRSHFQFCTNLSQAVLINCEYLGVGILSSLYVLTFRGCSKLESLYLMGSGIVGVVGSTASSAAVLQLTPMLSSSYLGYFGSIYVPASLFNSYKTAKYWSTVAARFASLTSDQIYALPFASYLPSGLY